MKLPRINYFLFARFLQGNMYVREVKLLIAFKRNKLLQGNLARFWVGGGKRAGYCSGIISGGKPLFVSVIYSPKARMRWGSVHLVASCPREETPCSRGSRALARAGQVRMTCCKVAGPVLQRGQVRSGFSSNQEGWAAR